MARWPIAIPILFALLLAGAAAPAQPALVPATAADVLAAVRAPGARAVLVNVWATWCAPCREEFPDLVRLGRERAADGLRLVLVSADFESNRDAALSFLGQQGVTGTSYLKTGDDQAFIDGMARQWSGALPASFVYDANGRLVTFWEGRLPLAEMERRVGAVLGKVKP